MGRRFDTMLFPGGKSRAFTLSYDDGVRQDRRLAELFRRYGLKCSFNLNSARLGQEEIADIRGSGVVDVSRVSEDETAQTYAGHEICGHGLWHSALTTLGAPAANYEIIEDKRRLEALAGRPIKTFAYPYGLFDARVVEMLRAAGYEGARTVRSTHSFGIPEDFLVWDPTCHHSDPELMSLAERFVSEEAAFAPLLFYVWGHGYEFDGNDNWNVIEELAEFISAHSEDVWFASNGEIMTYVKAYRRLEYSVDGTMIYNPSAVDVYIRPVSEPVVLPAGKITVVGD